jgi:hypothetical protein
MPRHLSRAQVLAATRESLGLAAACLAAYWLAMTLLSRVTAVSRDDDLLGGMWAVLAAAWIDLRVARRDPSRPAATATSRS